MMFIELQAQKGKTLSGYTCLWSIPSLVRSYFYSCYKF